MAKYVLYIFYATFATPTVASFWLTTPYPGHPVYTKVYKRFPTEVNVFKFKLLYEIISK